MSGPNRIQTLFAQARAEKRALFVTYLCAGDPDFETSLAACKTVIEAGTDLLELGVPFSDPLADGLTNQLAAQRSLESGMTHEKVMKLVSAIREFSEVPIVFYTYYNLILAHGEADYAKLAKEAGVDGILTLDLPPEESGTWESACAEAHLQTVYIVAPTTPVERLKIITDSATGFLYYVSRTGVTGERANLSADLADKVGQIRKATDLPLVVGFGVSQPEHVRDIAAVADGVVVGSSIVNCIANNLGNKDATLKALHKKVSTLRTGLTMQPA